MDKQNRINELAQAALDALRQQSGMAITKEEQVAYTQATTNLAEIVGLTSK